MNTSKPKLAEKFLLIAGCEIIFLSGQMLGAWYMELRDWIYIGVNIFIAIIGFLGIIFGAIIPLARDSKTIDGIGAQTTTMEPQVKNINDHVEPIYLAINSIEKQSEKIDSIAASVKAFTVLQEQTSKKDVNPAEIIAQLSVAFKENAEMKAQHDRDQQRIENLLLENGRLQEKNDRMQDQIHKLEMELRQTQYDREYDDYEPEI